LEDKDFQLYLLDELVCPDYTHSDRFSCVCYSLKQLIIKPNDMKNRILPFSLLTLFIGFAFLFNSFGSYAENPGPLKTSIKTVPAPGKISEDHLFQMRANQVTGTIDPSDVLKAKEQISGMKTKSTTAVDLNWMPLGPDNVSGRTRAVLYDKNDPTGQTIYTGGVTGGIWRSTNGGLTWVQQNTGSNEVLRITCFTQTPNGTIYAGTGESYCNHGRFIGTGLYRSTDGINFTVIPSTQPTPNDTAAQWVYITKLACNPVTSRLFAATNDGLKYSDNGDDWITILPGVARDVKVGSDGTVLAAVDNNAFIAVGGDVANFINLSTGTDTTFPLPATVGGIAFAIAPTDPNILYASFVTLDFKLLNVYRSVDKGTTWGVIFPSNLTFDPFGGSGCYANTISVFANDPYQVLLGSQNIWRGKKYQETGYYSWNQVSFGTLVTTQLLPDFIPFFQHDIMFSLTNPNQFAVANDGGVTVGTIITDSVSFKWSNKNLTNTQFNSITYGREKNFVLGGGYYIGTQIIGAYELNSPMNAAQLAPGNGGNCAWSMIDPNAIIFSVSGLTPPFFRSGDLGLTVSPTFLGGTDPSYTNGIHSNLIPYQPIYNWESFNFENSRDSVTYKVHDDTIPANTVITVSSANAKFPFNYTTTSQLVPGDSVRVKDIVQSRFFIYGTDDNNNNNALGGIFMTKDAIKFTIDPQWFQISKIAVGTPIEPVTCISVSKDLNYLWGGTSKGHLARVSNIAMAYNFATADISSPTCIVSTETFDATSYPFLNNRYVTSADIARDNNNVVVITLGNYGNTNYVFLTENALDSFPTFRSVQGNLPAMPVYSCMMEMDNHKKVILGTDFGVYTTDDITVPNPVWSPANNGLGNVPVTMVKQQNINYYPIENYGAIYLSSYGRGLFMDTTFYMPLGINPSPVAPIAGNELLVRPNPFENVVNVTYYVDKPSEINAIVYDLMGKVVYTKTLGIQQKGNHSITLDFGSLPRGTYIVRINNAFSKVVKIH
jgi:hypothetical protein